MCVCVPKPFGQKSQWPRLDMHTERSLEYFPKACDMLHATLVGGSRKSPT